ncbi:MAG TPA: hypothetical protein VGD87_12815 [Archangium sp.]
MNYVLALELELKLEDTNVPALAGGILLLIEDLLRTRASYALAMQLRTARPELEEWGTAAPTLYGDMTSMPPPVPDSDDGDLQAVLARFGVPGEMAPVAASVTLRFIASRVPPDIAREIVDTVPMLIARTNG